VNYKNLTHEQFKELSKDEQFKVIKEMEEEKALKEGLPHLFGFPWYNWARAVFESENREILLTAANQVSKSSTAIRKNIHWATWTEAWPRLWPNLMEGQKPNLFWYFYPNKETAGTEFETKWLPEFLPRGQYEDDPRYGWQVIYKKGDLHALKFNTGVTIQFKTYAMRERNIQASTVYHVTADEEMPLEMFPEIKVRLQATRGYYLGVFTATIGQDYWRRAMEPINADEEVHKSAFKQQISLFDCETYMDGTPSRWNKKAISEAIAACPTELEVQRRVYGKFVKSEGLLFESFDPVQNVCEPHDITNWTIYGAVDPGSGGKSGHPTGISFLALSPDSKEVRVINSWRGDGIQTAHPDILEKWLELKKPYSMTQQIYDGQAKDFFIVATRVGEPFIPANKAKDAGYGLLNSLLKNRQLKIWSGVGDNHKLINEFMSVPAGLDKRAYRGKNKDDLADATRYAAMAMPVEMEIKTKTNVEKVEPVKEVFETSDERRRRWFMGLDDTPKEPTIDDELSFWGDLTDGEF